MAKPTLLLDAHLKVLRLPTFLREYDTVARQCAQEGLDCSRDLFRLCELELLDREQRAVERRIKAARFPVLKSLETFEFRAIPSVNKRLVLELARSEYLDRRENVLALGNSGTGKTHLALALGLAACQKGYRVRFTTAAALVNERLEARDDKRLLRFQKQLAKQDLLIVDELGYVPLSKTGAELLFERLCCNFRAATSGWTTFGKHRTGSPIMPSDNPFKWRQFEPALILQCVRWYLRYALSYRDLEDMMRERGLCVDHTTIYRWVQRYAPEIDKRCRPFLRRTNDSYRIDETYVRVAGAWTYLYRGVDSNGDTLDFLLRATRDRKAAIAFFRKTLGAAHTTPPRVVTVDKNPAYPVAFEAVRHEGLVRPRSNLRQCKYLNNIIEQDHRFIKRRTRPMLGFKRFTTAWRTLRGIEIMHALRKGQARWMAKGDVVGQTQLIHKVFGLAA